LTPKAPRLTRLERETLLRLQMYLEQFKQPAQPKPAEKAS
jgi:hypothetical protein